MRHFFVYLGSASGPAASPVWTGSGDENNAFLGNSIATTGDVNGDGFSDIIAGAYGHDAGGVAGANRGRAYIYLGNDGPGISVRPMQLRSDLSVPIAPLGGAMGGSFRVSLTARTPFGRGKVRLEWQAAPLGYLYPLHTLIQSTNWTDSGTGGTVLTPSINHLYPAPFLWRARTRYQTSTTPFQDHGPWFTPAASGLKETDLRFVPPCNPPDEPVWLYSIVKSGTDYTLNFEDPNQPDQRTGWNIRRSNNPALLPKSSWPLVGSNVVDMDAGTPNYQWTDHSGDEPGPGGIWYYQVTAYNAYCSAEGPF